MSLQSPPQLHRPHHLQRGAVRRHCHGLLWARPRHLPQPGRLATAAHCPVQLQVAQRWGAAKVQMNATFYAILCKKLLHKDKWPFRIERNTIGGFAFFFALSPRSYRTLALQLPGLQFVASTMLELGRCLCSMGVGICLC